MIRQKLDGLDKMRAEYFWCAPYSFIKPLARRLRLSYKASGVGCTIMATFPDYVQAAMRAAQYERMENGEWFASIPQLAGIWGAGPTIEDARANLLESLPDWLDVHIKMDKRPLPEIDGVNIYKPLDPVE